MGTERSSRALIKQSFRMSRKDRVRVCDDPRKRGTRPDTNAVGAADGEATRVTRVDILPAAAPVSKGPSPSHPYGVLVARELPLYPGIPQMPPRYDEPTVPDAQLWRGSAIPAQAPAQVRTTEHTAAPPSGTRNRGSAPELPPVPEPPAALTAARARELERMIRLVTPLPTNEWSVAPSVHEWRDEWSARRELATLAPKHRPNRLRARTVVLVVLTLMAAAVVGTGLGDRRKITRLFDRVSEFVGVGNPTPATLSPQVAPRTAAPASVVSSLDKPPARATVEPPRHDEVPAIPTMRIADLPLLAAPTEETEATRANAKKSAAERVTPKASPKKQRPARQPRRK
jgi:hypothetical protein